MRIRDRSVPRSPVACREGLRAGEGRASQVGGEGSRVPGGEANGGSQVFPGAGGGRLVAIGDAPRVLGHTELARRPAAVVLEGVAGTRLGENRMASCCCWQ